MSGPLLYYKFFWVRLVAVQCAMILKTLIGGQRKENSTCRSTRGFSYMYVLSVTIM